MKRRTFTDDERAAYTPGTLVRYRIAHQWEYATIISGPHHAHSDDREYMLLRSAAGASSPPHRTGDQLYVPPSRIRLVS